MRIMYLADLTAPWINTLLQYYFWAKKSVIKIKENKKSRKKREEPHYFSQRFPVLKQLLTTPFILFLHQNNSSEFNEENGGRGALACVLMTTIK